MRLGDFLTLSDLGLDGESKVEFYDMKQFNEDILAPTFSNLYMIGSEVENKTHAPYGLLVGDSSLIVFFE